MKPFNIKLSPLALAIIVASLLSVVPAVESSFNSNVFAGSVMAADDEPRKPPASRSSQQMSRRVYQRIEEVVEFQDLGQYAEAKSVLDELKVMDNDDRLNDREQYMMWVFYANIAQAQEFFSEALTAYGRILELDNMREADIEQTLRVSGQLSFVIEDYEGALDFYLRLLDVVLEPNSDANLRVAHAYYQLERFAEAIPYLRTHMDLERAAGEDIPESTYSILTALYYTLEDYPSTLQSVRERITLFNTISDWPFLAGINGQMEKEKEQASIYYVANAVGYLSNEGQLMNLAAQLYNNDNPFGGAEVVRKGMEAGIIKENESNLSFLSTSYQIAREDELAVEPLLKAAPLSDDGTLYVRLGNIYSNLSEFEKAIDAFRQALDKGGLDRQDSVYLWQARAFRELNRFDEGISAARSAGRDERSASESKTWVKLLNREQEIYKSRESRRAELAGYFR